MDKHEISPQPTAFPTAMSSGFLEGEIENDGPYEPGICPDWAAKLLGEDAYRGIKDRYADCPACLDDVRMIPAGAWESAAKAVVEAILVAGWSITPPVTSSETEEIGPIVLGGVEHNVDTLEYVPPPLEDFPRTLRYEAGDGNSKWIMSTFDGDQGDGPKWDIQHHPNVDLEHMTIRVRDNLGHWAKFTMTEAFARHVAERLTDIANLMAGNKQVIERAQEEAKRCPRCCGTGDDPLREGPCIDCHGTGIGSQSV